MKYVILASGVLGLLLLYLLTSASGNSDLFSHNYSSLLSITAILTLGLTLLVAYQLWQLRRKLKDKIYGAKLTLRLVVFFSLIAVFPGLLVYAVSVQFLDKSIESWFDVRVEKALEGGLNLGRTALDNGLHALQKKAQYVAQQLPALTRAEQIELFGRVIDRSAAEQIALFDTKGELLGAGPGSRFRPVAPDAKLLQQADQNGSYSGVDTMPDNSLVLRALVKVKDSQHSRESTILQLVQPVPQQVSLDADAVQSVYRDYQELTIARVGLKRLYGIALTLSLLIVLLSAVSAAFFLSSRLSQPLEALAEGTRAVAQGNYTGKYPIQSTDELGALTGLFNQMTAQLSDAKKLSEWQQRQVEKSKAYLESVLTHLSSGVLVVDEKLRLRSANHSASQILGVNLMEMRGTSLELIAEQYALLRTFIEEILHSFSDANQIEWQRQIERLSKNGTQILLLRGTRLSSTAEAGFVIVFDDISHLLQAERQAAWGEVARRLAHEIKNPLTPIQLSAERLQYKLSDKLQDNDALMLTRATQTIVSQVAAMKNMVTEFADYARAPAAKLVALDMHQLLHEVLGLYEANSSPITQAFEAEQTWVQGDATRLRQVIHNLLHNAHDAMQHATDKEILLRTQNVPGGFRMSVLDRGTGFSEQVLARAFEPYMTTKSKGTGLGLPIVKKIVEEHNGSIHIENREGGGTCVSVTLPLAAA